jgi:PHD/YefM family antitoxin component YafN of YafNO toxin-antitoxin module
MSDVSYSVTEARAQFFGTLVRRAAHSHDRIAITDHSHTAAILINPQDLTNLKVALAVAQYRAKVAEGTDEYVSHEELRRRLGLVGE